MFSEVLKITPKLDSSGLNSMEKSLNSRFSKVAKRFGSGLVSALKLGGIAGLAIGLIDKVLNPLQQVQEAIDKALNNFDDLSTFAKQFNTTEGNLSRLQSFGTATGLDAEGVRTLLGKFQSAVANAAADPSQRTAVSNFVGKKDTAEAFFEFIQAMQKLTPVQQNLVQQEVFGQKQILKASEFLGADFKELSRIFAQAQVPSSEQQTSAAQFLGKRSDNRDTVRAIRDQKDLVEKAKLINDKVINGLDAKDQLDLKQENINVGNASNLTKISLENQKLMNLAVNQFLKLAPIIADILPVVVQNLSGGVKAVENSRALRCMTPGAGKDK